MSRIFDQFGFILSPRSVALAAAAALGLAAGAASAATDSIFPSGSFTVDYQSGSAFGSNAHGTVQITSSQTGNLGQVSAGGFAMDVNGDPSTDFTAFCLDISHYLKSGTSYTALSGNPTGNVFDTSAGAVGVNVAQQTAIQNLFDAVYTPGLLTSATNSAAFQLALWEIVDETHTGSAFNVTNGSFKVYSTGGYWYYGHYYSGFSTSAAIVTQANAYLASGQGYTGPQRYNVTYLQSQVSCPQNSWWSNSCDCTQASQNLVTVSAVPVPAAGVLLLSAFGGLGFAARRRRKAA